MSLNSLAASNNVPFFPPGIASHKTISSYKRPHNVKECKKISKGHFDKSTLGGSSNRRLSKSTPNLKVCLTSENFISQIPKHHCDMGLLDHNSLERNRSLFEQSNYNYNTRSLDRVTAKSFSLDRISAKSKSKTSTTFAPDRPFYPPSKYPNIHDKTNTNLHRLLETRQQYKTPKSRRSLSIQNRNKFKSSRPENLSTKSPKMSGSVPNLNLDKCKNVRNDLVDYSKMISENSFLGNKDQMNFSPEIGLYRQYNKLDLQDEFNSCIPQQMSTSYFYPKPIPNSNYSEYHDKMAQSLYNESSLAAKIQTGSLERASRNNLPLADTQNKIEVTDLDDSPTKSYSPVKQCNSFSQDSLDGNRKNHEKKLTLNNPEKVDSETTSSFLECDKSNNTNSEDVSLVTESKTYKFQSSTEEDLSENQNKILKSLSTISEKDRTIEEQKKSELVDHDNFYKNLMSNSILNKENLNNEDKWKYNDKNNAYGDIYNGNRAKSDNVSDINDKAFDRNSQVKQKYNDKDNADGDIYNGNGAKGDNVSDINDNIFNRNSQVLRRYNDKDNADGDIYNGNRATSDNVSDINDKAFNRNSQVIQKYNDKENVDGDIYNGNRAKGDNVSDKNDKTFNRNSQIKPLIPPKTYKFQSSIENAHSPIKTGNHNNIYNPLNPNLPEDEDANGLLDQYNLDRYIKPLPTISHGNLQSCFITNNPVSIHNEFLDEMNNPSAKMSHTDSMFFNGDNHRFDNTRNWKTEECYCIDKPFTGESLVKIPFHGENHQGPHEIDSTMSTFINSVNTEISGLDYDLTQKAVNQTFLDPRGIYSQVPRIALNSKSIDDSSSEAESSLSGSDDTSYMKYEHNSMHFPPPGTSWVSSPELTIARSDIVSRRHRRYLQSDNPLKPLCNVCYKPAYFMERISINNIIFHKMCFLCRKCETHLSFNNCIIHRRKPYCIVHAKPKMWKTVRSASASKLNQIKERLDSKSNLQKQSSTEAKQPKRVFYGGIKMAKDKFLQESSTTKEPVLKEPKRFTPPRQGVTAGIIESEPKPRDPNVVTAGDNINDFNEDLTRLSQTNATKERLAQFKEMQEKSFDKGMVNGDMGVMQKSDIISVDTKSLRNKFLSGVNDVDSESRPKRINPSEEIQELARKESNTVYENEPTVRMDVVKSDQKFEEENMISKNKAKELKDLFSNYTSDDTFKKSEKFQMEIGEGGIYESNPKEHKEDVIQSDSQYDINLPNDTVKAGLQKIKELQNLKSQGYQKTNTEPIKLDMDTRHSGIFENTVDLPRVDSFSDPNEEYLNNIREKKYANEAKKAFLEKQQLEEKGRMKKDTPQMIDIWKDLCPDSGVFENNPTQQNKDVMRHDDHDEEKLTVEEKELRNKEQNPEYILNESR